MTMHVHTPEREKVERVLPVTSGKDKSSTVGGLVVNKRMSIGVPGVKMDVLQSTDVVCLVHKHTDVDGLSLCNLIPVIVTQNSQNSQIMT